MGWPPQNRRESDLHDVCRHQRAVSSLLSPFSPSPPSTIIRLVLDRKALLVLSEETISELNRKTSQERYLLDRISPNSVGELVASLREIATFVPAPAESSSGMTPDPKDDHLVTGDRDLLEFTGVEDGFILTAAELLHILGDEPADNPQSGT